MRSWEGAAMSEEWILLIDPFRNLRNAYRIILEGESYSVDTAMNIQEALDHFSTREYSVVMTEYFPPFEHTQPIIEGLRKDHPETYIMMVTNQTLDELTYDRLFSAGLDDLILKPYSPGKILVHLRKGLRQRELLFKKREAERRSFIDTTTGEFIFNADYFRKSLRQEVKRATRHQHPLSMLIVSLKAGKKENVQFEGFNKELARILRRYTREEDIIGRENGGFEILLPETDQNGSHAVMRRLSGLVHTNAIFQSNELFRTFVNSLSIQSVTYPHEFSLSASMTNVVEEIKREFPQR